MRGIRLSRGQRASAVDPLRGASVGAVALLLLLGGSFFAPGHAVAQAGTDDSTPDTTVEDTGSVSDELPTCAAEVAGLELATTLDFSDVARALGAEGASASPTGAIVGYQLYCPYGELAPSAPSDAAAPLELLLSWGVEATLDGPGCFEGGEQPEAERTSGVVGDPDRRAQVDWSLTTDEVTGTDALAGAEDLLALAPSDTVSCEADVAAPGGGGEADDGDGGSASRAPLYVIGAAAVVALLAGVVLLVRRRRGATPAEVAPGVVPGSVPVAAAVGPSPMPEPLVAGATAPQRAARGIPTEVLGSMAAAGAGTSARAQAVVGAARRASPSVVGSQAAALALVAAAAGTMADADARRHELHPDEQVAALAAGLRTLARSASRSARRAASAQAGAPSAELEALVHATTRLLDAHRPLLSPPAPTETPR